MKLSHKYIDKINKLLNDWHEAGRTPFNKSYPHLDYDRETQKRANFRSKYVLLDEGTSGVFVLEIETGNIYRIKSGYGVPNKRKLVGTIDTVTGEDLNKYRWY